MVSDLFMKDYRAMTASGVEFTPEDVVRLNALAVKIKVAANPLRSVNLPRVCWLTPKIVLREPLLGHEMWLERVGTYIDLGAHRNFQFVHAFALSRDWADLPDPLNPKRVIAKVFAFAKRRLLGIAEPALGAALDYVLFGADWTAGEFAPARRGETEADPLKSMALGVWTAAGARRIPLTLGEAKNLTASQILEAVDRADALEGKTDADGARHRALADYVRAREEVRARWLEAEPHPVENGNDAVARDNPRDDADRQLDKKGEIVAEPLLRTSAPSGRVAAAAGCGGAERRYGNAKHGAQYST